MPPQPIFNLSKIDTDTVLVDRDGINRVNPQRFEFQQLDAIIHLDRDAAEIAGYRDIRDDEFWVRGHIPGRPVFPGVLMVESAAQLVSYYYCSSDMAGEGFFGFGGVDGVKFRGSIVPGQRIILLGKALDVRPRRCIAQTQGFVDGKLVFEGKITGLKL